MKLLVGSVSSKVLLLHVGKRELFLIRELEEKAEDEAQWPEDPSLILLSRVAALSFTGITSVI